MNAPNNTQDAQAAFSPATGSVVAAFEFDDHPKGGRRIEVREDERGSLDVVLSGKEELHLFGADLDQWGTWYAINGTIRVAQEWGTRSFIGALIAALEKFREQAEAETLPPTQIHPPNVPVSDGGGR